MLLKVGEGIFILVCFWIAIFQILLPALAKRPWFPIFRTERQEIDAEVIAANEAADVAELRKSLPVKKDENVSI